MEKLIVKFKLPMIENLALVTQIVSEGYRKTGNKFEVSFRGSKGYLDHIAISCEGRQAKEEARIGLFRLTDDKGRMRNVMVEIFHSEETGVRVAIDNARNAVPQASGEGTHDAGSDNTQQ